MIVNIYIFCSDIYEILQREREIIYIQNILSYLFESNIWKSQGFKKKYVEQKL